MLARTMPPRPARPPVAGAGRVAVRRLAFAAAVALNLAVLLAPQTPSTGGVPGLDKAVHAVVFAALTWTGLQLGWPTRRYVPVMLAWAVLSELLQATALPDRSGDLLDALADAVGVLLAALAHRWWRDPPRRGARRARLGP